MTKAAAPDLYRSCEDYDVLKLGSRQEWLSQREGHIAGSDASAFVGMNPYKSSTELWREKKHIVEKQELHSDAIDHGNDLEPVLRYWFQQSHKDYDVQYRVNTIMQSRHVGFMRYSPDGLLWNEEEGRGILELKTTMIQNSSMLGQWDMTIPQQYYIQVLHGLLVLNFSYVRLVAELRFAWNERVEIRQYSIDRAEVEGDLEWLLDAETENWKRYYEGDIEPPTMLRI